MSSATSLPRRSTSRTILIAAFGTFGVAFVDRPIGAWIFGHFGDRLGRKRILVTTQLLMGCATVMVGATPTADQIGIAAPILIVLLRIVQGIAAGGELAGAALFARRARQLGSAASGPCSRRWAEDSRSFSRTRLCSRLASASLMNNSSRSGPVPREWPAHSRRPVHPPEDRRESRVRGGGRLEPQRRTIEVAVRPKRGGASRARCSSSQESRSCRRPSPILARPTLRTSARRNSV
ncbi:MFS transporter [Rhodococcus sp. LB1]|uniref:MFS transporter n=1 Tax=Rhodococcus sp. LB1 TaxID=1807499 RepID=UPI0012E70C6B